MECHQMKMDFEYMKKLHHHQLQQHHSQLKLLERQHQRQQRQQKQQLNAIKRLCAALAEVTSDRKDILLHDGGPMLKCSVAESSNATHGPTFTGKL